MKAQKILDLINSSQYNTVSQIIRSIVQNIQQTIKRMKFNSFAQLFEAIKVNTDFNNEIKLKRLKKELDFLASYQNPSTSIDQIQLTSVGVELLIKNTYRQHQYLYKMLLDFQYPFNRPMIFYLKNQSSYAQCKDLLDILLDGSNWGPSLMLTYFIDKIQNISEIIRENTPFDSKQIYHTGENYRKAFLQDMDIKLFQVEEYSWRYLIKSTKKRMIGLNNETLMLFSLSKHKDNLLMDFFIPINEIVTAKASVTQNKKFNLQISYKQAEKEIKLYFGGQSNIEQILGYLNPIQMIQRKISQLNKGSQSLQKYWSDNTQMVRQFTQLIEYYSLKDTVKAQKYIKMMKQMIAKFYQSQNKLQQKQEKKQYSVQKEEIQT